MATLETIESMLSGLSAEERADVLEALARRYEDERAVLEGDLQHADELADVETPGMIDAGRFKVAASPMEHMAGALRQGLGAYGRRRARGRLDESIGAEQDVIGRVQNAIMNQRPTPGGLTRQVAIANALRARERGR